MSHTHWAFSNNGLKDQCMFKTMLWCQIWYYRILTLLSSFYGILFDPKSGAIIAIFFRICKCSYQRSEVCFKQVSWKCLVCTERQTNGQMETAKWICLVTSGSLLYTCFTYECVKIYFNFCMTLHTTVNWTMLFWPNTYSKTFDFCLKTIYFHF